MSAEPRRARVFYSWQSDLPDASNRAGIWKALTAAALALEGEIEGVRVDIDEATRGAPGSLNIPATILAKIDAADIVVCHVTTINGGDAGGRRCPNPNVVFELG